MPAFEPGREFATKVPTITVDPGLRPGEHRFELVVIDDQGRQSAPDERVVTVLPPEGPGTIDTRAMDRGPVPERGRRGRRAARTDGRRSRAKK